MSTFLNKRSTCLSPLVVGGTVIESVTVYKLLGVYISSDLSWNAHCEYLYVNTIKRLYGLRVLKKSGLALADLVSVYCSVIRAVLEYGSPAWVALPKYLSDLI